MITKVSLLFCILDCRELVWWILEKIFRQTLLYDFYGELLTEHQRNIYEDAVCHDMSLSEIAQQQGISRQGVHDMIKRCDKILMDYEDKLKLVQKFMNARETVREIVTLTEAGTEQVPDKMNRIRNLAQELLEEW